MLSEQRSHLSSDHDYSNSRLLSGFIHSGREEDEMVFPRENPSRSIILVSARLDTRKNPCSGARERCNGKKRERERERERGKERKRERRQEGRREALMYISDFVRGRSDGLSL